jgi:hypothetical protein
LTLFVSLSVCQSVTVLTGIAGEARSAAQEPQAS